MADPTDRTLSADLIRRNLAEVKARIQQAAVAAGRGLETVRLVAVTKTVSSEAILHARAAGQLDFGENRVQELAGKAADLPPDCVWHMIGHLQQNKAREAVRRVAWLHSVDSVALLERLERLAAEAQAHPTVLLQVNLSGEASKSGVPPDQAANLVAAACRCVNLTCRGFMTMAPFGAPPAELHRLFGSLRRLRDRLAEQFATPLPELSMGMSGDFEVAIAEGATLVRIGTAIFGVRSLP
jgi:pyridoxal phosphate enzyme (YggS family)